MRALPHPRQAARLAVLRAYGILDTPREDDFDEIVALASEICGVPISVVNLIDAERQWFKAEVGLGVRETPLETSICSHVILERDFVEISDTLTDRRMQDNALCTGNPGLRFYAGALLKNKEGLPLGTLCVLDYQPRQLTDFQRRALRTLANQVMTQLDLRMALKRQELLSHEIDHRVKNSLQAISALVRMQRRQVSDAPMQGILDSVDHRIQAVSLLHEELYRSDADDKVDFARFVTRLVGLMGPLAPQNVELVVAAEPCVLDSKRASAAGIIVTELIANSLKHAFPDDRPGTVRISATCGDGVAELICEDNGVGSGAIASIGKGLGLRITEASAAQLGAVIERAVSSAGFRLRLVFAVE